MTVYSHEERTKYSPSYIRKERKFINLSKKFKLDDKSNYKVTRKLGQLLEDRLYILLRYGKIQFKIGFFLFVVCYYVLIFRRGWLIIMIFSKKNALSAKEFRNLIL
jgi:hypothetical protein